MKTPERRLGTGIFRWLDPGKKGGWKESEKGPAPGWGWPSLGGLPTPAPLRSPKARASLGPAHGANNAPMGGWEHWLITRKLPRSYSYGLTCGYTENSVQEPVWNFC